MAKLEKGIHFTATIDDLCFYQVYGRTYLRRKSSLTRKRVLQSKEYAKTRDYANKMGLASQIASVVYKELPADSKARWVFRTIAGEAASLLYSGKNESEVKDILWTKYIGIPETTLTNTKKTTTTKSSFSNASNKPKEPLEKLLLRRWKKQGKRKSDFKIAWQNPRDYDIFLGRRKERDMLLNWGIG